MSLAVTIMFSDNTSIDAGVSIQLLSGGVVVSTAITDAEGRVKFDIDPGTLTSLAINLAPQQSPPTNVI